MRRLIFLISLSAFATQHWMVQPLILKKKHSKIFTPKLLAVQRCKFDWMFWNRRIRKTWGCLMRKFQRWHAATLLSARSQCMTVSMWHTLGAAGVQGTSILPACLHRQPQQRSNKSREDIKHCFSTIWLGMESFRRQSAQEGREGCVHPLECLCHSVSGSSLEGWAVCSKQN